MIPIRPRAKMVAAVLTFTLAISSATSASATTILAPILIMELKDATIRIVKLLISQIFGDNRGAAVAVAVKTQKDSGSAKGSWIGGTQIAKAVADKDGFAVAAAYNHVGSNGKNVIADGNGVFASYAEISWKGEVKFSAEKHTPAPISALRAAIDDLPLPEDVLSARIAYGYQTDFEQISLLSGSLQDTAQSAFSLSMSIDGQTVFDGSVSNPGGGATFSGDLAAYSGQFNVSKNGFQAGSVSFGGSYEAPVDYAAFYQDGGLVQSLAGEAQAAASGAPEPGTWALMVGGFGLAGAMIRRRRALPA